MALFRALETALSGLRAHQAALEVSAHNVANANNPGYSRQVAAFATTNPLPHPGLLGGVLAGMVGTGVTLQSIDRVTEGFTFHSLLQAEHEHEFHQTRAGALEQLEAGFLEPSEDGLSGMLNDLFASLQEVSVHPEESSARAQVLMQASRLAAGFRSRAQQLVRQRQHLDEELQTVIGQVNAKTTQIAAGNERIVAARAAGLAPNDFLDQREADLRELAQLIDFQVTEDQKGMASLYVGGRPLVLENTARLVRAQSDGRGMTQVAFVDNGLPLTTRTGRLSGLQEVRDQALPRYLAALEELAVEFVDAVNVRHRAGFGLDGSTGVDLFTGAGAGDMAVNEAIAGNPARLAASATGAPGDGANALALARLQEAPLFAGSTDTVPGLAADLVAALGLEVQNSQQMARSFEGLLSHLQERRDSQSAVSLDEEAVNLMRFQQGYTAAARVVKTVDEMTETLLGILS